MPAPKKTAVTAAAKVDPEVAFTPTVAVVPPSEGKKPENRYYFKCEEREDAPVYSVPHVQYLSGVGTDYMEAVTTGQIVVGDFASIREMIAIECPEAKDDLKKLSKDQVMWISGEWGKASTASVGESSASDDS